MLTKLGVQQGGKMGIGIALFSSVTKGLNLDIKLYCTALFPFYKTQHESGFFHFLFFLNHIFPMKYWEISIRNWSSQKAGRSQIV